MCRQNEQARAPEKFVLLLSLHLSRERDAPLETRIRDGPDKPGLVARFVGPGNHEIPPCGSYTIPRLYEQGKTFHGIQPSEKKRSPRRICIPVTCGNVYFTGKVNPIGDRHDFTQPE